MSARDWFGVAARVLGIWLLIQAVSDMVMAFAAQNAWTGFQSEPTLVKLYLMQAAANLVFGILLVARAQFFIGLAYPETDEVDADPEDESSSNFEVDG